MIAGDEVVHELRLEAGVATVFAFFVEPEKLVRWIGLSAELEPRPGGGFRFEVAPGEFCEGRYVEVSPPRRVVFTWGWANPELGVAPGASTVSVDLAPADGGTHLRLVHRGLGEGLPRRMHDDGWARFLARLDDAVAGRAAAAYPAETPEQRRRQLGI